MELLIMDCLGTPDAGVIGCPPIALHPIILLTGITESYEGTLLDSNLLQRNQKIRRVLFNIASRVSPLAHINPIRNVSGTSGRTPK